MFEIDQTQRNEFYQCAFTLDYPAGGEHRVRRQDGWNGDLENRRRQKMSKAWELVKAKLEEWNGYCEKATNAVEHIEDKIANAGYNEFNRFAKWLDDNCPGYLNKVANQSWIGWCTVYLPWVICELFGEDAAAAFFHIPGKGKKNLQMSVGMTANYFKGAGEYHPRAGFDPQEGDIAFFDPAEKGGFAHVGWVYGRADNGKVITSEGNTGRTADLPYCGGCTAIKQYWTYDKRITGYARPDWAMLDAMLGEGSEEQTKPVPAPAPAPEEKALKLMPYTALLKQGSQGDAVDALQRALDAVGFDTAADPDGVFGRATDAAVRAYQKSKGLQVDGLFGPKSYAALEYDLERIEQEETDAPDEGDADDLMSIKRTLHFGCQGEDVRLLQEAMVKLGSETADDDGLGIFGFSMMRAVGEFELEMGMPVDGVAEEKLIMEIAKAVST